jgi:hypothetical protein
LRRAKGLTCSSLFNAESAYRFEAITSAGIEVFQANALNECPRFGAIAAGAILAWSTWRIMAAV